MEIGQICSEGRDGVVGVDLHLEVGLGLRLGRGRWRRRRLGMGVEKIIEKPNGRGENDEGETREVRDWGREPFVRFFFLFSFDF